MPEKAYVNYEAKINNFIQSIEKITNSFFFITFNRLLGPGEEIAAIFVSIINTQLPNPLSYILLQF